MIKILVHHNLQLLCGSLYNRPKPIYCFFLKKKTETSFLFIDSLKSVVEENDVNLDFSFCFFTGNRGFINVLGQLYHNWTKAQNKNTNTFMSSWGSKLDTSPTASDSLRLRRSPPSNVRRSNLMHLNLDPKLRPFHRCRLNLPLPRLCSAAREA